MEVYIVKLNVSSEIGHFESIPSQRIDLGLPIDDLPHGLCCSSGTRDRLKQRASHPQALCPSQCCEQDL